jgi:transcriptional regulator with XRE-family HTH domain
MPKFNREEFGNNLKKIRKSKGLSQKNLADILKKDATTIGRFESGRLLPNAEEIALICEELNISEYELFELNTKIANKEKNINPFKCKNLFLYYKAYFPSKETWGKGKFKLVLREKGNICDVDFTDYRTGKIYLSGYLLADDNVAMFIFENYKPTSARLEVAELILNISDGLDGIMVGTYLGTNGRYEPSIRKCVVSKDDLEFDEEMFEILKIKESEKQYLNNNDVLQISLRKKEDFENE